MVKERCLGKENKCKMINGKCYPVVGSNELRQKVRMTEEEIEDAKAEADMNKFIDAQELAAKRYWDSVIEW